ncbi:MAG TPA: hypothetical protein VJ842_06615 [Pyrinomonadaceae bacterium]|nr:hypothetical protein [Pyrinomonadaceae bacterium]
MVDIRQLINTLSAREESMRGEQFLAPCVGGGRVRVSVDGLVQTFRPRPRDFEGWGIFQPVDDRKAQVVGEATIAQVANYLRMLKPLRVRLAERLRGQTWLAYPANREDARRQFGAGGELKVNLVREASRFEQVVAYTDGRNWFYGELDRRADARVSERLRTLLRQRVEPRYITWKGITPEIRAAYQIATEFTPAFHHLRQRRTAALSRQAQERRLRDALALNGGQLVDYEEEGDSWRVRWQTRYGEEHTSTVAKRDLTIISAGICLSDQDSDFDLQSLVGVVEKAWG